MRSLLLDIIETSLLVRGLSATQEQQECMVATMRALMPDKGAAIEAANRLICFYGKPLLGSRPPPQ